MSPLSLDLRRRIIQAWEAEKVRVPELANRFAVGTATVKRLVRRFRVTGSVEPLPHGGGQRPKIPAEKLPRVQRLLEANPDWSVEEITAAYNRQEGARVSRSTMVRAVARLGFTRKKSLSSPRSATQSASRRGATASSKRREPSPLRVWFLWTKPARTRR
jgi:transposase